jgi:hypothetical protein
MQLPESRRMIDALFEPCFQPSIGLPEPKYTRYQEEVRGGGDVYVHRMFAMGIELSESHAVDQYILPNMAAGLRAATRGYLLREFWRYLGAA